MFHCKIDQKGWSLFNGMLGMVPFENGISTRPLTENEVKQIGASIRLVRLDSNEQIGPTVTMANSRNVSAEIKTPLPRGEEEPQEVTLDFDREKLEVIAEEGGIKAIRVVASKYNVKGVEINKMINEIIEAQTKETK